MCILFNFSSQDKSLQIGGCVQAKIWSEGGKFVPFVACVRDMDDNSLYLSFMRVTSVNGEDLITGTIYLMIHGKTKMLLLKCYMNQQRSSLGES